MFYMEIAAVNRYIHTCKVCALFLKNKNGKDKIGKIYDMCWIFFPRDPLKVLPRNGTENCSHPFHYNYETI